MNLDGKVKIILDQGAFGAKEEGEALEAPLGGKKLSILPPVTFANDSSGKEEIMTENKATDFRDEDPPLETGKEPPAVNKVVPSPDQKVKPRRIPPWSSLELSKDSPPSSARNIAESPLGCVAPREVRKPTLLATSNTTSAEPTSDLSDAPRSRTTDKRRPRDKKFATLRGGGFSSFFRHSARVQDVGGGFPMSPQHQDHHQHHQHPPPYGSNLRNHKRAMTAAPSLTMGDQGPLPSADSEPEMRDELMRVQEMRSWLLAPERGLRREDFDLRTTVGTGTFGRVRLAAHRRVPLSFPLVLKILKKAEVVRLKQVEHVKSEKAILSNIYHPFIVNLFAAFQDDQRLYMVMEYVNGGELFSYLRKEGRLAADAAKFYAAEITTALEFLHARNIAYRDLKPENLLLDTKGHLRITDFGFAKVVDTRTWTVCGTPEYLSPEVIQSKGHGTAVDWWALGILIFEMIVGHPPFFDDSALGIYQKVLAGRFEFPKHFDPRAKDLVKKLLVHDPAKRLGSLKDGAQDIMAHPWFRTICWEDAGNRRLQPPFVPKTKSAQDTSNFDSYPESDDECDPPPSAEWAELFGDF